MEYWHLNFATVDRMPLFPAGEEQRRQGLRRLAALRSLALILFCIVDDHFHAVVRGCRAHAGQVVWRIKRTWAPLMGSPLSEGYYRRVEGRQHMRSLVRYHLQQSRIHSLGEHPALWSGSCFSDLIGARRLRGLELGAHDVLPRLGLADLCRDAGLDGPITAASDDTLRAAGIGPLVKAASFALATSPRLAGQEAAAMEARAAVTQLAAAAGLRRDALARELACSPRTLQRLNGREVAPEMLRAIRLRLALLEAAQRPAAQRAMG